MFLLLSLIACSRCPDPEVHKQPAKTISDVIREVTARCKDAGALSAADAKECASLGIREYPGGIYNFKASRFDDAAPMPTLYTGSIKSFATTDASGVPLSGVEKTCWPDGVGYPYDTYVPFGSGYKQDKNRDWSEVTNGGSEQCAGNKATFRTFARCGSGAFPACWTTDNSPTLPGNMPVNLAQGVPHAGRYEVTSHQGSGPDVVAVVVMKAVVDAPSRRVEEWCLTSGFGWPSTNTATWPKFSMESPEPVWPTECPANDMVKFNTEVF